ncbi:hypothetical protein DFP83_11532 [Idiomarina fontislapidosi]|uniref:Uncharacterized protein n=1 Tax=Idiomarina fontislapidosi TaxID=263723 RepID=A0A432XP34_9GAMM|nr:hypothetical protein [Idiomarina fontislapidosi]PYE30594.1 hypothetical protein DFP83_11532 [Idiomarina fontislapidosi]RUO50486.1 hypothetical protein CWE25_12265 [Idiomarina fontislapidosi]
MQKITILKRGFRQTVEISKRDFAVLKSSHKRISEVSKLANQYAVFKTNLNSFEREVISHAIDVKQRDFNEFIISNEIFARADHILISHLAAFMRFPELLPSHLAKIFSTQSKKWAIEKRSALYDTPCTYYAFLCELRNAIIHSNVALVVDDGVKNMESSSIGLSTFGYFIDFERFLSESVDKPNKREILTGMKEVLCNKKGRVDLVKALSTCSRSIFKELVEPTVSEIKAVLKLNIDSIEQVLITNELPSMLEMASEDLQDYLVLSSDELEISKIVIKRTERTLSELTAHKPIRLISIAPSFQE